MFYEPMRVFYYYYPPQGQGRNSGQVGLPPSPNGPAIGLRWENAGKPFSAPKCPQAGRL